MYFTLRLTRSAQSNKLSILLDSDLLLRQLGKFMHIHVLYTLGVAYQLQFCVLAILHMRFNVAHTS